MARCGCGTECQCTVVGSGCVEVGGSGSSITPYTVGLSLPATEVDTPGTSNTWITCVDDLLTGYTVVYNTDTDCIALDGDGSVGDPLNASPVFSADAGNVLECRADGMFVASPTVGGFTNYAFLEDNGAGGTVLPADGDGKSAVNVSFDTNVDSLGITVVTAGAYSYVTITSAGFYFITACVQGWGLGGPTYQSDMILRTSIYVDPAGAPAAAVAFQAAAPLVTTVDVTGNSPMVQVSGVKQLGVGDKVYVAFSAEDWQGAAFPGATLTTTYPSSAFFQIYKVGV